MKKSVLALLLLLVSTSLFAAVQVNYLYLRHAGCDSSGVIAVYGSGGNGTYSYKWSNGHTATGAADSVTNLREGIYRVTCYSGVDSAKTSFNIYAFGIDTIYRFHACHGEGGRINISYVQATWPVHTQWLLNGDSLAHDAFELDSLHGGIYTLYMVDTKGCELRDTIKIGESSPVFNVYTSDTVVCSQEWATIWYTPGFTLVYQDYFAGSSNDTIHPINNYNTGLDFPYCGMDSEGCIACDDTLPEIIAFGYPWQATLYRHGDTISIGVINLNYDSTNTYGWNKPFSYEETHYNYYVADTPGNYHVTRRRLGCVTEYGTINVQLTDIHNVGLNDKRIQANPNPASNFITITAPPQLLNQTIQVYDITGRLVDEIRIIQTTQQHNIVNLARGTYMLKTANNTIRVVKE
ncbi:MAG TPA: T9SS type A sorting domain-containing protein [Chitinophagales bacterium]|nr:T9SS type A sorting domain-containing protein [Chitinophagales bacterium]